MQRRLLPNVVLVGSLIALGIALLPTRPAHSDDTKKATPEQATFFENNVRPVFAVSCTSCHGKEVELGGLRLDGPISLERAKELLRRVRGEGGKPRMPEGGAPLAPEKIAALESWVKQGAPWPAAGTVSPAKLWSLEPVKKPEPPAVKLKTWARSPIDRFILARLENAGLKPATYADRRTLIRRATFDLTGLPPTAEEVDAFVNDRSPDAWASIVDRLLASPHYGERQARLWMDIARYADTKGYVFTEDRNYYNAYTYRDFLIRAFNEDLGYDQFLLRQLAADKIVTGDDKRDLAALGFLTIGRRFINNTHDILDDRIDVTMRGLQGLTVSCARCHDHKFDPIPTQDYYSLYAIFASGRETSPIISPKAIADPYAAHDAKFQAAKKEYEETTLAEVARLRERVKLEQAKTASVGMPLAEAVKKALQGFREGTLPDDNQRGVVEGAFEPAKKDRLVALRAEMKQLQESYPPKPEFAMGVEDAGPFPGRIFKRGNPGSVGDIAPRRFLSCITGPEKPEWPTTGRLELAQAITDKNNPLTARVFVNRVWLQHFGYGLVRTPSDFGKQGEKPTHPELLDWLAATFMNDDNWSVKKLHRRILLSATYLQSSDTTPATFQKDPENRLLARQNRRRLELEQLRDALLFSSGSLDLASIGGKSEELWTGEYTKRRSVYGFVERQNLPGIFKTFDFASPDATSPQRFRTIVPQQALFLFNGKVVADQARLVVRRDEIAKAGDDSLRIKALYRRTFARLPNADELRLAQSYLASPDGPSLSDSAEAPIWSYGWGEVDVEGSKVSAFHVFTNFGDEMWRAGTRLPDEKIGWAMLTKFGGHPGDSNHPVVRRWTSPTDGTVTLSGTLRHPGKVGDGVRARVIHSRLGKLGEWVAQAGESPTTVESVAVRRGDTLDFVVDCRANENTDAFSWAPTVRLTTGKKLAWRAEKDFMGPQPAATPLSKWERLAQALLMTNEFSYID